MHAQASAFHSGGIRKFALPDTGPDPTDIATVFAAVRARRRELIPERRLMLSVVMASVDDLRRCPIWAKPYATAYAWLMNDDEDWPFAFRPACAALELDPEAVRARMRTTIARFPPELLCRAAS